MLAAVRAAEVVPSSVAARVVAPLCVGASLTLVTVAPRLRLLVFQALVLPVPPLATVARLNVTALLVLILDVPVRSTLLSAKRTLSAPGEPK